MKPNQIAPILPTQDLVRSACKEFDEGNAIVEAALRELFQQYPHNDNEPQILFKVVILNRLYSTNIFAVHDMAHHIWMQGKDIDSALAEGDPEIVDKIAPVTITATLKGRNNYSFASKYCSWHNDVAYPIWDSRVDRYLRSLRRTDFAKFLPAGGELWNRYPEFVTLMTAFRNFYDLRSFSFKDIDKFLWKHGESRKGSTSAIVEPS
jgi:hypothetical protein